MGAGGPRPEALPSSILRFGGGSRPTVIRTGEDGGEGRAFVPELDRGGRQAARHDEADVERLGWFGRGQGWIGKRSDWGVHD